MLSVRSSVTTKAIKRNEKTEGEGEGKKKEGEGEEERHLIPFRTPERDSYGGSHSDDDRQTEREREKSR